MTEQIKNNYVSYWLLLVTFLVILMILLGGITRLTDSGLSITRWDLFYGILPPTSLDDWKIYFSLYKEIPEYKLLNYSMTLNEFKKIFWWEYLHRLLGRIIGLLYFIPLLFFTITKKINKNSIISLYLILILIFFQGFVGWYMVQSGLTIRTDVSQYRLSLHLALAFVILILLFWNFLEYINYNKKFKSSYKLSNFLPEVLLFLFFLQIVIGAFVSGLDAVHVYKTWPLMDSNYFPNDSSLKELFSLKVFDSASLMQFIHRNIAYFIFLFLSYISIIIFSDENLKYLKKSIILIFILLVFQIFLGVFTLLSESKIILASLHQFGSIVLILTTLNLVFKNSKN